MKMHNYFFIIRYILLLSIFFPFSIYAADNNESRVIKNGWYEWTPYQSITEDSRTGFRRLSGLDVELVKGVFKEIDYDVSYIDISWAEHQEALKTGALDIAAGAVYSDERAKYSYLSAPYRSEVNVLIMPRGNSKKYPFKNIEDMLKMFKEKQFRLGVVAGYRYTSPIINQYIADPGNKSLIVRITNETANFENLFGNKIDGFFVDRNASAHLAWKHKWQGLIEEHPNFKVSADLHVLFSKASTNPQLVEEFNSGLKKIKESGEYGQIEQRTIFPILLAITVQSDWFFIVELIGTIAFALSGILIARSERYAVTGAVVLACLPALGGGIIRDLIVDRYPIGIIQNPVFLICVLSTVLLGFVFFRLMDFMEAMKYSLYFKLLNKFNENKVKLLINLFDSIGLASFTIVGVVVAVEAEAARPLWLWGPLLAVLTSVGGGLIRDMLRSKKNILMLTEWFYAEVSVIWGLIFVQIIYWQSGRLDLREFSIMVIFVFTGVILTRLTGIHYNIKGVKY